MWPPSAFYMDVDDNLRITAYNALAGVVLGIRSRIVAPDGSIQASADTLTPNTDRTAKSTIVVTAEGWLLGAEVFATTGTPLIGQCFVVVEIVRGLTSSAIALQTIASGYCTSTQPLAWPGTPMSLSLDGAGAIRSVAGTTPGAGADISETVPTGARWELIAFLAIFTASATVATRITQLQLSDGTNVLFKSPAVFSTTASGASSYGWAQGMPLATTVNAQSAPAGLPVNHRLGAGYKIVTSTTAIQVGDQWSAIRYLVREWLEGA